MKNEGKVENRISPISSKRNLNQGFRALSFFTEFYYNRKMLLLVLVMKTSQLLQTKIQNYKH